jgi:hypothetical protein
VAHPPSAIRHQSTVHPQQAPARRKTSQATPNYTSLQRSSSSAPPAIAAHQPAQHHLHHLHHLHRPLSSHLSTPARRTQHSAPATVPPPCIVHQTCAKCPSAASAEGQPVRSAHSLTHWDREASHSTLLAHPLRLPRLSHIQSPATPRRAPRRSAHCIQRFWPARSTLNALPINHGPQAQTPLSVAVCHISPPKAGPLTRLCLPGVLVRTAPWHALDPASI